MDEKVDFIIIIHFFLTEIIVFELLIQNIFLEKLRSESVSDF